MPKHIFVYINVKLGSNQNGIIKFQGAAWNRIHHFEKMSDKKQWIWNFWRFQIWPRVCKRGTAASFLRHQFFYPTYNTPEICIPPPPFYLPPPPHPTPTVNLSTWSNKSTSSKPLHWIYIYFQKTFLTTSQRCHQHCVKSTEKIYKTSLKVYPAWLVSKENFDF